MPEPTKPGNYCTSCHKPERSDREVFDECNALARRFYKMHGYEVPEGYRFDQAHHPQECLMWYLALAAFEDIDGTNVEDCYLEEDDS